MLLKFSLLNQNFQLCKYYKFQKLILLIMLELIKERNLAALTLSNLRNLAAVIAIPDRLTPGIKEKICKKPIIKLI